MHTRRGTVIHAPEFADQLTAELNSVAASDGAVDDDVRRESRGVAHSADSASDAELVDAAVGAGAASGVTESTIDAQSSNNNVMVRVGGVVC